MLPLGLSPYEILGLDATASTEDGTFVLLLPTLCISCNPYLVRRAYRRKALETHPDKLDAQANHEEKLYTEDQFRMVRMYAIHSTIRNSEHVRQVCEAFEILGDPQKRQVSSTLCKIYLPDATQCN